MAITEAEIFTARRCCSGPSVRSFSSDTRTAAAAPSPVGQHMSTVLGYDTIGASITCSSENAAWYWARGLSVEWAWFFSATAANCFGPTPSCCRA